MINMFQPCLNQPIEIKTEKLTVRLAKNQAEIEAAQRLRYKVFIDEMGGKAPADQQKTKIESDEFDPYCDHLIAIDEESKDKPIVGTYRLLRKSVMLKTCGHFYTSKEYDVSKLIDYDGEIMEVGRSCIEEAYRSKAVIQQLWQGLAAYMEFYDIHATVGCASFSGTNVEDISQCLAYLYHYHLAPPVLRVKALEDRAIDMNVMPAEKIDRRMAMVSLPPLIKGYLRAGSYIGEGAVIDKEFNTIDVCIILKTDVMTDRYKSYLFD